MNNSPRTVSPARDSLTLFALASGLAMGHVVAAMAAQSAAPATALPSALVFLVCSSAGVLCALAAVPQPHRRAPPFMRWTAAIGVGLLVALLLPALLS